MPGGDKKGPNGEGPMTGRKLGLCTGNSEPGFMSGQPGGFGPGRGVARGAGRGRGLKGGPRRGGGRRGFTNQAPESRGNKK